MAPSQRSMLALLGLVASVHAVPAALPAPNLPVPSDQIGLNPPRFSISWQTAGPEPTEDPEEPEQPVFPLPTPTDQFSLGPPSYTISWDTGAPTDEPEEPEYPIPHPTPSNQISLNPPSYSVSWQTQAPPQPTKNPGPGQPGRPTRRSSVRRPTRTRHTPVRPTRRPTPIRSSTTSSGVRQSISWATGRPSNTGGVSWDGVQPSMAPPQVTWNKKRQYEEDPEPTAEPEPVPEDPEFPEEPLPEDPEFPEFPEDPAFPPIGFPLPTPKDSIGIQPPKATVIWGKRQYEEDPQPTPEPAPEVPEASEEPFPEDPEFPEFPEDPEFPEFPEEPAFPPINFPLPTPKNSIGIQPPTATVIWGKRQDEPEPSTVPELPEDPEFPEEPEFPEDPDVPTNIPVLPTPPNSIGIQPPRQSMSWGKRQDEAEPTTVPELPEDPEFPEDPDVPTNIPVVPTPPNSIGIQPPRQSMSWGKRQYVDEPTAAPQPTPEVPEEPLPEDPEFPEEPFPEDPEFPEDPDVPTDIPVLPTPPNSIGIQPPRASMSWGKRQYEEDPVETEAPADEPTDYPLPPQVTPPNEIGIQPPKATIIWGKEKREPQTNSYGFEFTSIIPSFVPPAVRPTGGVTWGKRQDEEEPVEDLPLPPIFPTSTDEVSMQPPQGSMSWGKREAQPQTDDIGIQPPEATIIWGKEKREPEAEAEAQFSLVWPSNIPRPSWGSRPTGQPHVSWGRRDAAPEPTAAAVLAAPEQDSPKSCALTTTVSRIRPCPQIRCTNDCPVYTPLNNEYELVDDDLVKMADEPSPHEQFDCPATVTATNKCPFCSCTTRPTPVVTPSASCATIIKTVWPEKCREPTCPEPKETPCDYSRPVPKMVKKRVVEKRVVTIKSTVRNTPASPPIGEEAKCTVTRTAARVCPTFTCVPWQQCDLAQVVR